MTDTHRVDVTRYPFSPEVPQALRDNAYASGGWPLVYVLSDGDIKRAYVGETTDAITRLATHLKHEDKQRLGTVHLISSDRFNKSATLDIESSLIRYLAADGQYTLMNGNLGLVDHNYYQKDALYSQLFRDTWDKLRREGVATRSLESIDNSDVFKYSPYKCLSHDQRQSLLAIMRALLHDGTRNVVVQGGAGTGKTVLAVFLFKLLHASEAELSLREFSDDEQEIRDLLLQLRARYADAPPRMALVVPMASFRKTVQKIFRHVSGLKPAMVVGPADLARRNYDIVLVDEAHRLRHRRNLGSYFRAFDNACAALGMDNTTRSEVDWVLKQSGKAVFFYDASQSIRPSDASAADFQRLRGAPDTQNMTLVSQFRVKAGRPYADFVRDLLHHNLPAGQTFSDRNYEFALFDSLADMVRAVAERNARFGLGRLIAGYAWPWVSNKDASRFDIEIDDVQLRWNRTNTDWINQPGSEHEVGCIHTTQGYDLNYAGIIFGPEIRYDRQARRIVIDPASYHDKNGKVGIQDPEVLHQYILNIYQTIMMRGIRGTFVYVCDPALRAYFRRHIPVYVSASAPAPPEVATTNVVPLRPWENAVPLYDLRAAAGAFSEQQLAGHQEWVAVPPGTRIDVDHFACRVVGQSMNRVIPDGAICLFRRDPGGSRNGKIVLVEFTDLVDRESGSRYTVKEYESISLEDAEGWRQTVIRLHPRSDDPHFQAIELTDDPQHAFAVVGVFKQVLETPEK